VTLGVLLGAGGTARAGDPFAWTPRGAPVVARGHEAAARFDLLRLVELTVEVDDAFSAENRAALGAAEQRLAAVPGVRRVFGPSRLLEMRLEASGRVAARTTLSRGTSESDGEEARQRVVRRADALGWFLSANGRLARFYVDVDDVRRARRAIVEALAASGLALEPTAWGDGLEARVLFPDPRAGGAPWWPAAFVAAAVAFIVVAGLKARPLMGGFSRGREIAVTLAAAVGAAAPFVLVRVPGVRIAGAAAALAAAAAVQGGLLFEARRKPPRAWNRFARPPLAVLLLALTPVVTFAALRARLRVGTHQWSAAPLAFVDVRADCDQPAVLHELARLAEFLRAQPGVEDAWSVADLFAGLELEGEEASRVPPDPEDVRQVLAQARVDPAVALELSADHREALVVVRFDDEAETSTDRQELAARLETYLAADLRGSLISVDLRAPGLPLVTRGVAKGLLASDTRERVVGICARSGRPLTATEALAVDRVARQAAAIPTADPGKLRAELADDVRAFLTRDPVTLHAGEQARLVDALAAEPDDARAADVERVLSATYGPRLPPRVLADTAAIVAARMAAVRWRHTARINFHEMLYGADLPTEGVLADQVRTATLEGMGPVVGIPVAHDNPAALHVDVALFGGVAQDRLLSESWLAGLRAGGLAAIAAWAVLLVLVGGGGGLGWLPLALAPATAAALGPALAREPVGLWSLSLLAGAMAAGGVVATAFAARRSR
jgi:hypothetical protein